MKNNQINEIDKLYIIRTINQMTYRRQLELLVYWRSCGVLNNEDFDALVGKVYASAKKAYCSPEDNCDDCPMCRVIHENREHPKDIKLKALERLENKGFITAEEKEELSNPEFSWSKHSNLKF